MHHVHGGENRRFDVLKDIHAAVDDAIGRA
jgi:hypothetical protein